MRNVVLIAGLAAVLTVPVFAQSRPDFSGTWVVESVQQPERPKSGDPGGGSGGGPGGGMGRGGGMGGMGGGMGRGGGMGGMGGGMMGGGRRGGGGDMGGGQQKDGEPRGERPDAAFALPQKGQQFKLVQTDQRLDVITLVQGVEQTKSYIFAGAEADAAGSGANGSNGSNGSNSSNDSKGSTGKDGANKPVSRTIWEGVALVTDSTLPMPPRGERGDGGDDRGNGGNDEGKTRTMREVRHIDPDGKMVVMTTMKTPRGSMTSTVTFTRVPK